MGFSRQEYCSGLPFPSPGDLPDPGTEGASLHWQTDSLPMGHQGSLRAKLVAEQCLRSSVCRQPIADNEVMERRVGAGG